MFKKSRAMIGMPSAQNKSSRSWPGRGKGKYAGGLGAWYSQSVMVGLSYNDELSATRMWSGSRDRASVNSAGAGADAWRPAAESPTHVDICSSPTATSSDHVTRKTIQPS